MNNKIENAQRGFNLRRRKEDMKKGLVILTTVLSMNAFASLRIYNSSDVQVGIKSDLKCGNGVSCSLSAGKFLLATGVSSQVASTTAAITADQCGSTFVSNSADVMTLPEASTVLGCRLTFVCGTADDFDINPADGTDAFSITGSITGSNTTTVLAPAAGDALRCTDIGASFIIEAVGNNLWAVLSTNGIITDVN